MLGIIRPGQAPLHGFSADRNIAQPGLDEALHFVAAEVRADEIGLALIQLQKLFLKGGQLEEVILLGNNLSGTAANGTIDRIGRIADVKIVVNAIAALVEAFVDITCVAGTQQQSAHGALVFGRSRANEMSIADAQFVPQIAKNGGIAVHVLARRDPRLGRGAGNVFAVLIGAGEKRHVVTLHALEAGDRIGHQRRISRAHVGTRIGIVDRRRQVELRAIVGLAHGDSEPEC